MIWKSQQHLRNGSIDGGQNSTKSAFVWRKMAPEKNVFDQTSTGGQRIYEQCIYVSQLALVAPPWSKLTQIGPSYFNQLLANSIEINSIPREFVWTGTDSYGFDSIPKYIKTPRQSTCRLSLCLFFNADLSTQQWINSYQFDFIYFEKVWISNAFRTLSRLSWMAFCRILF